MAKKVPVVGEDIFVARDAILAYFDPKPGRTTFFDWVNEGKVIRGAVKGYYMLNKTLVRLGLPQVNIADYRRQQQQLSKQAHSRQLHFLALTLVVPEALDVFSQEEVPESLTPEEAYEVRAMSEQFFAELVEKDIADSTARLAFVGGALKGLGEA